MLEIFGLVGKMAKGFWVKTSQTGNFKTITGFFVKVSPSTWQTVNDAWVKVKQTGSNTFQSFWQSATNPDSPIEILTSFTTTSELLRLQGKNYRWTPTPSTLFYTFSYVNNDTNITKTLTSSTSTSNPSAGSSITVPSSTTYRTISKSYFDDEYNIGGLSTYRFTVTGTTSSGAVSVQSAEYSMRTPKAPTLAVERLSNTSVKITITGATSDDFNATYRYIVSTYDAIGGTIESGGGRGGYGANSDPTYVTLTGLTAGRLYYIYVTPFTGSAGSTEANATGYAGVTANITTQGESDYTFAFGNSLHVGTNGYISLDSGNVNDAISSTTGRVIGIFPGDLYQDTTTSIWYWSNTTQFIIRWEGYHYNEPANLRQYEIVFDVNQNYATVYAISVANTTEGTSAWVKDGVTKSSYVAALTTGAWRQVYFDGVTTPSTMFGPYITKSKSVMKQVTGFTSGTQDQGYTTIVTSTNQNVTPTLGAFNISSFTKAFPNSSSQGVARTTTLNWGASSGASAYQVQYQGSTDNSTWVTVQGYSSSNNISGTSDTKTWSSGSNLFPYYTFTRANVRSLDSTGLATYVYSNGGSYVEASGQAPGQVTFGTITKTGTTASIPFTVGTTGSNYLYTSIEYQYRTSYGSYPGTWSTSVINTGAGTIGLTGLIGSTTYYIKIRVQNYDDLYSTENETTFTTNAALVAPTSTSISSMSRLTDTTVQAVISSNGAGGPYYQLYWNSGSFSSIPTTTYYDAASTSSTVTDVLSPSSGTSYYFLIRSSDQYIATTTSSGSQTSGSYSDYGPSSSPATYSFSSPSGGTVSVTGSSTVGSTLTASLGSPSASPSADSVSIVWRVNDGGAGGNSYTSGSILQSGGTTFVIPQYLYGSVSSVGYLIRAEVTWNNGVGSQSANSTSTAVTAAGVAPSGGSVTLSPSGTQMAGTTITANVSAMSGTATISYTTTIRKKTGSPPTSNTDGTEVASGTGTGNVASHTITATEASGSPDQFRAFTTGTNSFGNNTVSSNTVVSTPYVAPVVTPSGGTATVTPSSGTAGSTTYTASTSGWSGSPTSYSYSWQYFSQVSFSYVQYSTGSTFSPPSNINSNYPNYGWLLSVGASNTAGTAYATTTFTVNSPAVVTIPSVPTGVTVSGSGAVSWDAVSGATSYEVLNYTDRTGSPANTTNRLGPYTTTGITGTSFQLTSTQGYSGSNNYARAQVRARNSAGVSSYSAWYPSSTTYV
jgi:hypothetical protein